MSIIHNPEDATNTAITKSTVTTDCPECVFWLPCDETDASITTLTDAIAGNVITIEASTASSGIITVPNDAVASASAALPTLTTDWAMIALLYLDATVCTFAYGANGANHRVIITNGTSSIVGAGGTANLDAATAGSLQKFLVKADTNGDGDSYLWQGAPGAILTNTLNPLSSAHGALSTIDQQMVFSAVGGNAQIKIGGFAVFDMSTNGIPADFNVWADWTLEQWADNNKVLPERFKRL